MSRSRFKYLEDFKGLGKLLQMISEQQMDGY